MTAKVILATPERGLYAVHVRPHGSISVFEVVEGPPLRIGDIVQAKLSYIGRQNAEISATKEVLVIDIIKTDISPVAAHICLDVPDECRPEEVESPP